MDLRNREDQKTRWDDNTGDFFIKQKFSRDSEWSARVGTVQGDLSTKLIMGWKSNNEFIDLPQYSQFWIFEFFYSKARRVCEFEVNARNSVFQDTIFFFFKKICKYKNFTSIFGDIFHICFHFSLLLTCRIFHSESQLSFFFLVYRWQIKQNCWEKFNEFHVFSFPSGLTGVATMVWMEYCIWLIPLPSFPLLLQRTFLQNRRF